MIDTVRWAETVRPTDVSAPAETDGSLGVGTSDDHDSRTDCEVLRGDLDRASLRRVQTPQGFALAILRRAHEAYREEVRTRGEGAREATDDAGLVERLGVDVVAVDGDEEALKITYRSTSSSPSTSPANAAARSLSDDTSPDASCRVTRARRLTLHPS